MVARPMDKEAPEGKVKSLGDKLYGDFSPSAVPRAPDGGIQPGFAADAGPSRPEPTEENYICLRGPCRHFWHLTATAGEGNPASTWEALGVAAPREHYLTCLVHPGIETQLSFDELVHDCNRWDPLSPSEVGEREERRLLYQIRRRRKSGPAADDVAMAFKNMNGSELPTEGIPTIGELYPDDGPLGELLSNDGPAELVGPDDEEFDEGDGNGQSTGA